MSIDTLVSMRVFCLVVELKSFVAAANRLNISPAMASKHVMALERRLGTRLLNRTSRHLSLTETGALYFEQAHQMLENLEEVEATVAKATVAPRGLLRISGPVWLANPSFVSLLADYQARYPEVRLDIDLSGRIVNLVEEGFDLALRVARTHGDTLIMRPLARIRFQMVASPAYLARAGHPNNLADLNAHAMLAYSLIPIGAGLPVEGPDGMETMKGTPFLQSSNESLLHLAAVQGMGLAVLPRLQVEQDIAAGRLQQVLTNYKFFEPQLYGVYMSRKYLSSKVRTFLDFICDDARLS